MMNTKHNDREERGCQRGKMTMERKVDDGEEIQKCRDKTKMER